MSTIIELNMDRENWLLNNATSPEPSPFLGRDDQNLKPTPTTESYFNPTGLTRTNSIYTLSRASFSAQLSQLTSLNLPDASTLSTVVSAIPTAPAATKALSNAATQIQNWIQKAAEVLTGLEADDDVEWAATGGRDGLGEVDTAIGRFEKLINVYVAAIEELQKRPDVGDVPTEVLKAVLDMLEDVLKAWSKVTTLLKAVKQQVELAMEWEELWNTVLGDIGHETEELSRLVFEMEERRHRSIAEDTSDAVGLGVDIKELETIVEESPSNGARDAKNSNRFSLQPAFPSSTPLQSPGTPGAEFSTEDSSLLALFARMQPLRASLDFLPMRLSNFRSRAERMLPTGCKELDERRIVLEKKWAKLESEADNLRRELGEDRWVIVFRTAGRQAEKMCQSVERGLTKLHEAIDSDMENTNPAALSKRVSDYEAKKTNYGPAIQKVLAVIAKGVKERLTINGEVIRIHTETQAAWEALSAEICGMDAVLEELHAGKSQQLRDSISSIMSAELSTAATSASLISTPGSSPASSVIMHPSQAATAGPAKSTPTKRLKHLSTPDSTSFLARQTPSTTPRPSVARRNISTPTPLKTPSTSMPTVHFSRRPPSTQPSTPARPTPRTTIGSVADTRPRWNTSTRVNYGKEVGHPSRSSSSLAHAMTALPARPASSLARHIQASPLGRDTRASTASPVPGVRARAGPGTSKPTELSRNGVSPARPATKERGRSSITLGPRNGIAELGVRENIQHNRGVSAEGCVIEEEHEGNAAVVANGAHGCALEGDAEGKDPPGAESPSLAAKAKRPLKGLAGRRGSMLPLPVERRDASADSRGVGKVI